MAAAQVGNATAETGVGREKKKKVAQSNVIL